MLPMDFCPPVRPRERRDRAMHLLEQVSMADHAHKLPSAVSGGQQQRVAIARALANDPPILRRRRADGQPGLEDGRSGLPSCSSDLVASGKTMLMVTHDRDLAARVTRTIILADGEIVDEIRQSRRNG